MAAADLYGRIGEGGNLLSVRARRIRGRNEISVDTSLRGRELFARVVRL